MADQESAERHADPARRRAARARDSEARDSEARETSGAPRRRAPGISAAEAGRLGLSQIAELTGKEPESVIGVQPTEEGWLVAAEVVEDRRIPSSADILSTYEAELGPDGDLISYRRNRRYARGHGDRIRG